METSRSQFELDPRDVLFKVDLLALDLHPFLGEGLAGVRDRAEVDEGVPLLAGLHLFGDDTDHIVHHFQQLVHDLGLDDVFGDVEHGPYLQGLFDGSFDGGIEEVRDRSVDV